MKFIKITGLGTLLGGMLLAQDHIQLEPVVSVGTKTDNRVTDIPAAATVIDSEMIEDSGTLTLSELLESTPGVYISPSGSTISIRGMDHEDTLLLIDGKRVNGEFSKTYELQRIPTGMIERIEILKTGSSLLYGSDAMGGVINIITKKGGDLSEGSVQVVRGTDRTGIDAAYLGNSGNIRYSVFGSYLDRDPYTETETTGVRVMQAGSAAKPSALAGAGNWALLRSSLDDSYDIDYDYRDDLTVKNIGGSLAYTADSGLVFSLDASYMEEEKAGRYISDSYATAYQNGGNTIMAKNIPARQLDENSRTDLSLGLEYAGSETLSMNYRIAHSRYEKEREVTTPLYAQLGYGSLKASLSGVNESTLEYLNQDATLTYTPDTDNRILVGGEHRINNVTSTAYDVEDRTYSALFAQHEYSPTQALLLVYGARYDDTSIDEDQTSLSAGARYKLTDAVNLKANYAQGFRSPDDRELYVDQTSPTGKKMLGATVIDAASGKTAKHDLKSEHSETLEAGVTARGDTWSVEGTLYQTNVDDRIERVAPTGAYFTFQNVKESEIRGYETALTFSPVYAFTARLNHMHQHARNTTDKRDLTYVPESLTGLYLSYLPVRSLELVAIVKQVGGQKDESGEAIDGFTLTNFKLKSYDPVSGLDLFAGVDNLFEEETPTELGLVPESYYYAGMTYRF